MKYLKVFTDFADELDQLSATEVGRLFLAMLQYAEDGTAPDLKGNEKFMWSSVKKKIDAQRESYDKLCETNKRIASDRWSTERNGALRSDTERYEALRSDTERNKNKTKTKTKTEEKDNNNISFFLSAQIENENVENCAPNLAPYYRDGHFDYQLYKETRGIGNG